MRILFIWPCGYMGFGILNQGFEQSAINHGLCAISSVLKTKGYRCNIMDLRACNNWNHFENALKLLEFDVVVMGFYSVDEGYAQKAIEILKKNYPDKPVIVGGVHVTYSQCETFSLADCVVWGEGDFIVADLLQLIKAGRSLPKKLIAPIIEDLNFLPFIDRGLFNTGYEQAHPLFPLLPVPFHTINFSRGCPWKCSFCAESKNILWKKYRARKPENCITEIKSLEPVGSLMIHDDHLPTGTWIYDFIKTWDKEIGRRIPFWCQIRADWICKHKDIIPEMARIGMTWNSLGIEGSQRMLDFYNKKLTTSQVIEAAEILHRNKINIFGNYILGSPTETMQDITELEQILQQIRPEVHSPSIYTSYPGSLLYDFVRENNLWIEPIEDPNSHYCMTRFPYERKIVGVDYNFIFDLRNSWPQKYKGKLKYYE